MIFLIISTARLRSDPQNDITFGIEFTRECKILSAWLLVFYRLKILLPIFLAEGIDRDRCLFSPLFSPALFSSLAFHKYDFGAQH